ncbi:MAG: cyclic nucleotide-binding domain-containing protein [Labrys sp. (in: a-proteobacteria)]
MQTSILVPALRIGVALIILPVLAISFAVSSAAFVYSGPLAQNLSQGIGLAVLGIALMPIIVGLTSSYRGTLCHVQDFPVILIAGSAVSISTALVAAPDRMLPTIVMLIAVTTILTGVTLLVAGRFKVGALARFVPYSVIGGFIAATGYLLTIGALSMIVKENVSIFSPGPLFKDGAFLHYGPWMVFSVLTVVAMRYARSDTTLPTCLFLGATGFYVVLFALGIDLTEAGERGLLLGPFENANFLAGLSPGLVFDARWDVLLLEAPTIIAVVVMSMLGLLLNTSGLELTLGKHFDFETELKSAGSANIVSGMTGGFVGYHQLGDTIIANRMGVVGLEGALAVSVGAILTLAFGATVVGAFPVGLAGATIAILGLDMLYEWLVVQRRRLPPGDILVILIILTTASTIGFLESLSLGLVAATLFFTISYAGVDVVRLRTSGATRRSSVERSRADMARLSELGRKTEILELSGFIFFGTAHRLFEKLREAFASDGKPSFVVFNLARVTGADSTAGLAFQRVAELCAWHGATFVLAGSTDALRAQIADLAGVRSFASLDDALVSIENELLARARPEGEESENILEVLEAAHPDVDTTGFAQHVSLAAGEALVREGDTSRVIYQLRSGELRAEVAIKGDGHAVVARFLPGTLVGELAYYANVPRTATIRAAAPSELIAIDIDRIPESHAGRALAADLHSRSAGFLARRLIRMTNLFREAGF